MAEIKITQLDELSTTREGIITTTLDKDTYFVVSHTTDDNSTSHKTKYGNISTSLSIDLGIQELKNAIAGATPGSEAYTDLCVQTMYAKVTAETALSIEAKGKVLSSYISNTKESLESKIETDIKTNVENAVFCSKLDDVYTLKDYNGAVIAKASLSALNSGGGGSAPSDYDTVRYNASTALTKVNALTTRVTTIESQISTSGTGILDRLTTLENAAVTTLLIGTKGFTNISITDNKVSVDITAGEWIGSSIDFSFAAGIGQIKFVQSDKSTEDTTIHATGLFLLNNKLVLNVDRTGTCNFTCQFIAYKKV